MSSEFDAGPSVADATNVLLVAPTVDGTADRLCCDVLTSGRSQPDHVVGVTIAGSPSDHASQWLARLDEGVSYSFVTVDGVSRSAATETATGAGLREPLTVERVDSVRPLRELGERIAGQIENGTDTAVYFDSVTDLLECVEREKAFNFLHALGSLIRSAGATSYFHIDSSVHDEETLTLISTLFDAVVEVGTDGDGSE